MCVTFLVFDECTVFPDICINGECIDTSGSFLCECRSGFALDQTGKNCTGTWIFSQVHIGTSCTYVMINLVNFTRYQRMSDYSGFMR